MRDVIIIIMILGVIVFGSIYMHSFYDKTKNEFNERLESMSKDLENKKMNIGKSEELEQKWLEKEKTLIVFQAHDFVDNIEEYLYECLHYYETEEKNDFELAKEKLLSCLDDLTKREHVTLVNIF